MTHPTRFLLSSISLAAVLSMAPGIATLPAYAQMSSYEQQKVIQYLRTPRTKMKLDMFDGEKFVPGTDKTRAYNYMVDFINAMNKANRIVGTMTSHARGTTEGRAFLDENKKKLDYARAMQAAYPAFEKSEAAPAPAAAAAAETPAAAPAATTAPSGGTKMHPTFRDSVQRHLDVVDALSANGTFDGVKFDGAVSAADASQFYKDVSSVTNAATKALNGLPNDARLTDEGKELLATVRGRLAYANTVFDALEPHKRALASVPTEAPAKAVTDAPKVAESREGREVLRLLEKIEKQMARGVFDGEAFTLSASMQDADDFKRRMAVLAKAVDENFRKIPGAVRLSADGKAIEAKIKNAFDIAERSRGAFKVHAATLRVAAAKRAEERRAARKRREQAEAEAKAVADAAAAELRAKEAAAQAIVMAANAEERRIAEAALAATRAEAAPRCKALLSTIGTRSNERRMAEYEKRSPKTSSEQLIRMIKGIRGITAECSKPEYADLTSKLCGDAHLMCGNAKYGESRIKSLVLSRRSRLEEPLELNEDGFLQIYGATDFETATSFAGRAYFGHYEVGTESAEKNAELMDVLGITYSEFEGYDDMASELAALKEDILAEASNWPQVKWFPDTEGHYGAKLAVSHIERTHPDAEIIGVALRNSTWARDRRYNDFAFFVDGHILFKLPKDPLCQMRYFMVYRHSGVTEKTIQRSTYKKVRFQDCDRR